MGTNVVARVVAVLLLATALAGCVEGDAGGIQFGGPASANIDVIDRGADSGYPTKNTERFVFTKAVDWEKFWKHHTQNDKPRPAAPTFDWASQSVVALIHGRTSTGGHSIYIESALWKNATQEFQITYKVRHPGAGCAVSQAESNPFYLAAISNEFAPAIRWNPVIVEGQAC